MYIIAGLGNPGSKYEKTRHNMGFRVIDLLAEKYHIDMNMKKHKAVCGTGVIEGRKVMLLKPQTFMNLSGEAVRDAASFYKIPPEHVIVLSDDVSLDVGTLRVRAKGSAGGQNGLKNIIYHLNSEDFPRVKIGVGKKPRPDYDLAAWVLGKFPAEEQKAIDKACEDAVNAAACIIAEDCAAAAQKFNEAFAAMLPGSEYYPVRFVGNIAAARREMVNKTYDLVIINAPLPDDFGTRFAIDACNQSGTVALLLAKSDVYDEMEAKLTCQGVFTLAKPTSALLLNQSLKWLVSARERLRRMEEKATSVEEKMEEIRLVNRAKWLLIEQLKMTEAEAHRHIEKQAMDRCTTRREIALGIIKTYA